MAGPTGAGGCLFFCFFFFFGQRRHSLEELRFSIDAFRPDTIPMIRLAAYKAELAALIGHEKSVHFVRLDSGSVELVHRVDLEDQARVEARLSALCRGDGVPDAVRAYHRLDGMLTADNAVGVLMVDPMAVVIRFPGMTKAETVGYGVFNQQGSFDGVPVKVGGLGEMVPIHLQEIGPTAAVHNCMASREIARAIAVHLFETPIRAYGTGRWRRDSNGAWTLVRFVISSFEVLDDAPLDAVVAHLRRIQGSRWREVERPLATLRELRDEEGSVH